MGATPGEPVDTTRRRQILRTGGPPGHAAIPAECATRAAARPAAGGQACPATQSATGRRKFMGQPPTQPAAGCQRPEPGPAADSAISAIPPEPARQRRSGPGWWPRTSVNVVMAGMKFGGWSESAGARMAPILSCGLPAGLRSFPCGAKPGGSDMVAAPMAARLSEPPRPSNVSPSF